ncbi:nucleotide-binding protein [Laribacter hongkongensis]|uniref:nucleotide-binding protein n=1 Tax=Laribacter hongkongensis TaxID=168471 RepID=UPI001EFD7573|nr:zeta toxin family protein [Laribacter hongkongensis]MCG9076228.1 conjugal transfer protein TraL [Laribacter hongkongensis]
MTRKTAHLILQGKGGCGKSMIANHLAQYLTDTTGGVLCIDTDPVNRTFSHCKALNARGLELLDDNRQIDPRRFDTLVEWLLDHPGDTVVDNGASGFIPMLAYLSQSGAVDMLRASGVDVVVHVPIVGGDSLTDTANGFAAIMAETSAEAVVWLNPYFGAVQRDGKGFADSALYAGNASRLRGVIELQNWDRPTFGRDIEAMRTAGLTFSEAITGTHFGPMPSFRLQRMRDDLYARLDRVRLGRGPEPV